MRILNLYFKNINSLEGENRIDFEQPPFTDTGVFAITGPNGSGKSTILDAITLALYGETFRFDKPAQHVITQHTHESFSQIEFALGTDKYRSSWHVKRTGGSPNGEIQPTEMQLLQINGSEELIATSPQQVCARIAQISGMNFRNFTRSILLAQGDFTAFLTALDNERMDILEKIIGSDIYADYKKEATDQLAEAQKNLTYLQQDLAAVPLIEPASLEACEHDLADFSEQTAEYQEEINRLQQLQATFEQASIIKKQITQQETKLEAAIAQRLVVQKKLDQLVIAETVQHFQADIDNVSQTKQAFEKENAALTALRNELKQIENTLALPGFDIKALPADRLLNKPENFNEQKQAIDNLRSQVNLANANWQSEIILLKSLTTQIAEKQAALAEITPWLVEHAIDQPLLDSFPDLARLKNLRIQRDEFEEKKRSLEKWSKSTNATLTKNKDLFENRTEKLSQLKEELADTEKELTQLAEGHTLEQLEELQVDQKERVKSFDELVALAIANEKLAPKSSFFFSLFAGKKVEPTKTAEEFELERDDLSQQLKREENIKLSLEKAIFNDALIERMTHDRLHLIDGKPCPLCGATEHPYSKYPPVPANSQQALLDQRVKIKRITAEISQLEQNIVWAKKRAERNDATNTQLQQVKSRWHTLCNQLNIVSAELEITKIGLIKDMQKSEATELKNIAILLSKYKGTEKKIAKLKGDIEKTEANITQFQTSIQKIDTEWQTEPQRVAEVERADAQAQQEELELTTILTEQLSQLGEKLPAKGKEDALIERLNLRLKDYQGYEFQRKIISDELNLLVTKQNESQAQIDGYKGRVDTINSKLNTEEIVGLHLALVEKQKLIADKEQIVNQIKAETDTLDQAIANKMQATQFNSLAEISQMLTLLVSQPDVIQQKANLDAEVDQLSAELNTLYTQLDDEQTKDKPEFSLEEIELKLKSAQEKMDIAVMEAHRLETIVREQKQYKEKQAKLLAQLEDQQALVQQANTVVAQMSAENGMVFRRRVQAQMIERLLSQTNATLEKISGRYYIRQKASNNGFALEIEDTYQGNIRRLPKTLSGGESFIVSLALALALSELANNGKSVDSLFLDEGFGNLDAETLYTVINTLESLRAHGKTVGVISHVEAVQKRFKAQLQLVKKPNGLGELRKVS